MENELIVRRPKLVRLQYVKERRTIIRVRLTVWELICGYCRWFWYCLRRDWKEHRRRVESCTR